LKLETLNLELRAAANAAEQGVSDQEALQKAMEERSRKFVEKGAELYAKA
jgi:hypothetical protein